jgi:hypothetical protein
LEVIGVADQGAATPQGRGAGPARGSSQVGSCLTAAPPTGSGSSPNVVRKSMGRTAIVCDLT